MSTHTKSRRRPGRGPRRDRDRDRDRDRQEPRSSSSPRTPQAPVKLSLWGRIKALFSPKKASSTNGKSRPAEAAPASRHPAYNSPTAATVQKPSRKPEAVEVTSPKLYVGNLSFDATESDISELFKGFGNVQSAEIVSHKATEKSKGFGFVVMATVDEAKRAVETLHDKEFMGRKLVVSGAKTNERN